MATISGMQADDQPEPPRLRFLRRLVYVMTGLLLAGVIVAIVGIFVKLATGEPGGATPMRLRMKAPCRWRRERRSPIPSLSGD